MCGELIIILLFLLLLFIVVIFFLWKKQIIKKIVLKVMDLVNVEFVMMFIVKNCGEDKVVILRFYLIGYFF